MTFDVVVNDPCRTASIATVDITAGLNLEVGNTASIDFLEAVDAVETSSAIKGICGTKSYVVLDAVGGTAVTWISLQAKTGFAGTYTITAAPVLESFIGTQSYTLQTTLNDYSMNPGRTDTLTVIVRAATCNCAGVVRDLPAMVTQNGAVADGGRTVNVPLATINQVNSEAINAKIRKCYSSGAGCANTATFTATLDDNSNLPSFMVFSGTSITITPTTGSHIGTYLIKNVMTPTYGAPVTYTKLTVVISCTITSINDVPAPTTGLTYVLYDTTLSINLKGNVYIQTPPCGYITSNTFVWTIQAGAPITVNPSNSQ